MIQEILLLVFIAFCPALSYGVCHYKYAVEPSVYDGACSPLGIPAMFQCTIDITTDTRKTNCTSSIMWYFSSDFKSFLILNYEHRTDYTILTSPCLSKDSMFRMTSILNITAVKPIHFGYFWCVTQVDINSDPVHSSVGHLRDALVPDCHSAARDCSEDLVEMFQTNKDNVCASFEPPFAPPQTDSESTIAVNNCSTANTDITITETDDTVTTGPKGSGEGQAQVFIPLAILLLTMFIVIFILFIVIAILLYKRRAAQSTAEPLKGTNSLAIAQSENIDMDFESCKNKAYDSISAIRQQEANGLTDYVDMHEAAAIERLNNNETSTYQPPSDGTVSEDETYLHMHVYADIGEFNTTGTSQEPHAKTLT